MNTSPAKTTPTGARRATMRPLTARQLDVLTFIRLYGESYHCPPSLREICTAFGFSSPQAALRHTEALLRKDALSPILAANGLSRGWRLTETGLSLTQQLPKSTMPPPAPRQKRRGGRNHSVAI